MNIIITLNKIEDNKIVSSVRDEKDFKTRDMIIRTYLSTDTVSCYTFYEPDTSEKLNLNMIQFEEVPIKVEEISPGSDTYENKAYRNKNEGKINFPTMIKCQNCETNFPTKYQYQRHQCEFNAEKIILKNDTELVVNNDNNIKFDEPANNKIKYDCNVCSKQFVSRVNLERHQLGHENVNNNICEHCNKQFVSENRLRIHKENHCKKAGDISKFYRSDVTVWKCKKCHEVFSSADIGNYHVNFCSELSNSENAEINIADVKSALGESNYIEKVLTELLLQCEFCNRTYADKNLLLMHQRKHTTAKNYECVNCTATFESFTVASAHWMRKCSLHANLFYLPKLTYCEYCDRTFKSHEILYNHKVKKKHYTPKLHIVNNEKNNCNNGIVQKKAENKDVINKLIADVLKTLDVPVSNNNNNLVANGFSKPNYYDLTDNHHMDDSEDLVNKENQNPDAPTKLVLTIKSEPESGGDTSSTTPIESVCEPPPPQKGKRGRKRKWCKQVNGGRSKKYFTSTDEGFRYQCERCSKVYNTITALEMHRDNEHIASYTCEECNQTLHSAKALLIHSRGHKSLKPYVCDTCGRSYSQTSHLWQHMRFHQGIKPFACPHEGCEARYTIRPDLKDHIRKVHTRERPFKCNVCNKCFLTGSVYYQHRLIHTNDRRYGCDVCNKRFFRADALNNHKRIHTDERPYPCAICGREFRQKGDRNKHLRTQHPASTNVKMVAVDDAVVH